MDNQNLHRIQRVSGRFIWLFRALILLIPLLTLFFWLFFNHLPEGFTEELPGIKAVDSREFTLTTRMFGFLVCVFPMSIAIYGLIKLTTLFRLYQKGVVFSVTNADCFRRLGYSLIGWVCAKMFLYWPLMSVVVTFNNAPGERLLMIAIGSPEIGLLLLGAIVVLISWVMREAARLEEEQAFTV